LLSRIELRNFKSLADVKIELGKLTLLMGSNNSGKSSLLQALGFVKQSIAGGGFNPNGIYASLGSYSNILFKNDPEGTITISLFITPTKHGRNQITEAITKVLRKHERLPPSAPCFSRIGFSWDFSSEGLTRCCIADERRRAIICGQLAPAKSGKRDMLNGIVEVGISGFLPSVSSGPSETADSLRQVGIALSTMVSTQLNTRLFYLKTGRGIQSREMNIGSRRPLDVGPHGENTIPILAYIRDNPRFEHVIERINVWAEKFGFESVFSRLVSGPNHALTLTDKMYEIRTNAVDVGYGTNQLLPVFLQCYYAPKPSTILIEEPEMHLHPRMQADIVDFFLDVVKYGNSLVIETHSEHILARLQRRIAEGAIRPRHVAINYFEKKAGGTRVTRIDVDKTGRLTKQLPGFFEEDFKEAVDRIRASLKLNQLRGDST